MSRDSSRSPSRESVGRDRGSISRRDSGNGGNGNGESESDRLLRQLKARLSESSMEFEDAGYGSGGSAGRSYHSRGSSMSSNASRRSHNEGGEGCPRLVNFGAVSRTGHSSTRSSRDPSPMPNRRFACDDDDDDDNEHDDEDHSVLCFL
jgi:hypothetical protein